MNQMLRKHAIVEAEMHRGIEGEKRRKKGEEMDSAEGWWIAKMIKRSSRLD